MHSDEEFAELLSLAVAWAEEQELQILTEGVPLSASQLADAGAIGVKHAERVRLLQVRDIPAPAQPALAAAAVASGLVFPTASGLTLRYGIYLRADRSEDRQLVMHELVHTMQYERLGGIEPFLRQYLLECLTLGYANAPMEREAIEAAAEIYGA